MNGYATPTTVSICFKNQQQLKQGLKDIKFIAVESDKIQTQKNCADILTTPERAELFRRFIGKKYPLVKISSSKDYQYKEKCELQIEKVISENKNSKRIGTNGETIRLGESSKTSDNTTSARLSILSGMQTQVGFDRYIIDVTCTKRALGYEINITSLSDDLQLQNQFFLPKGIRKSIGSITSSSEDKKSKIGIPSSSAQSQKKKKVAEIFIRSLP